MITNNTTLEQITRLKDAAAALTDGSPVMDLAIDVTYNAQEAHFHRVCKPDLILALIEERAAKDKAIEDLIGSLQHMRVCQECSEGSWERCEGGQIALAEMKAYGAKP